MITSHTYRLSAYPKQVALHDGKEVILKPMTRDDREALLDFFVRVPAEERYYLKEDVTSLKVIGRWAAELDYDRALPLLAWANGKVVADGTLHRTRSLARRHVGEIRLAVDPEYRTCGLDMTLIRELATIADANGLERLLFQAVVGREDAAIKAAQMVGFVKVGVLPAHAKDMDGRPRDIVLLEMPLGRWFEWWTF